MFTQTWRKYWDLQEDPFACEDADKDLILSSMDSSAVHWGFDRIFGNPRVPAPGIVFGEKGSGKSALRLMMNKRIEEFNASNTDEKVFLVEYIDYNPFTERYRKSIGARRDTLQAAQDIVNRWKISDHLDCILSLSVTKLVDEILATGKKQEHLSRKQSIYLLIMTALYYNSDQRTAAEAIRRLSKVLRYSGHQSKFRMLFCILLSIISVIVGLIPILLEITVLPALYFYGAGLAGLLLTWGSALVFRSTTRNRAYRANRSVKVLPSNPVLLSKILAGLYPKERREFMLPAGSDEESRYNLLHRFIDLLESFGYKGIYVLVDRIDEPSLLSANEELMKQFIQKMLDIKLLQYPQMGLKLFLPIELEDIYRNASPEDLKRIRLDKSNLIPELKWSGQELYEIANQRFQSCQTSDSPKNKLFDLFQDDFDFNHLKETLNTLATPRYAFGFLSALFAEYVKELPDDLPENDPAWKVTRAHFDVVRAAWIDRTGLLRRTLN